MFSIYMTQDLDDIINNNWINVFPDPEGHWKIYCSLWLINVLAGQQKWGDKSLWNRQDVAIQAYLFIPALCCAELIAQLIMGHGASRALAATLAAHAQQLLLLTGDGGGGHLDHSRVLSYDFHVICETKPQKLNFWGSSLLVATILRFGNFPLTLWVKYLIFIWK